MLSNRLSKALRVITIAPVMAFILLTLMYTLHKSYFGSFAAYAFSVLFLVIFPVLAYPMQPLIPAYRDKGREGQRSLAMVMAGIGYCFGIVYAFIAKVPFELMVIYLTYLISGLLVIIFNKVLRIRASGHACGVAGPLFAMFYLLGPASAAGFALLAAIYWASLHMKRHSISELLLGTAIPLAALLVSINISSI